MRKILFKLLIAGVLLSAIFAFSSCATEGRVVVEKPRTEVYVHPYHPYWYQYYRYTYTPYYYRRRPAPPRPHYNPPMPPKPHGNVPPSPQRPPTATVRPHQNQNGSMSGRQRGVNSGRR